MTLEQRLAAIQYLANDLQDHIIRGLFLEIAVERLARKGGPVAQTLELAAELFVGGASLKNGKGNVVAAPTNLLEHEGDEAPKRRGRAALPPASPSPQAGRKLDDPRDMKAWVEDFVRFAAGHDGVLRLDDYYKTKLIQDYGENVKIGNTRLASSLNYAASVLKYFKRTERKIYALTAKGRALAENYAQTPPPPPSPEQGANEAQQRPVVEEQPQLFDTHEDVPVSTEDTRVDGRLALFPRMVAYAQAHGGQIHMGDFKRLEQEAGRSSPGGGAYKILRDPTKFKATAVPGVFDLVDRKKAPAPAPSKGEGQEPPLADAIRAYVAAHGGEIDVTVFRKEFAKRWGKRPQALVTQLKSTLRTLVFAEELRRVRPDVYSKGDGFAKAMAANA